MSNASHWAEVVEVRLRKHPNADKLSLADVHGYQVVVATDGWKDGDLGVYVPPDNLVPVGRPEFSFLAEQADQRGMYRVRAKKLRKEVSFGLLVPAPEGAKLGEDLAAAMGIEHYNPPEAHEGGGKSGLFAGTGNAAPPGVPSPDYDLEPLQRFGGAVFTPGEPVVITEKLDGCLRSDVLVTMGDGTRKPIGEVKVGDRVMTYRQGAEVFEARPVTNKFVKPAHPDVKWLEITLDSGDVLVITSDHLVLTERGWVEAGRLTTEDNIISI